MKSPHGLLRRSGLRLLAKRRDRRRFLAPYKVVRVDIDVDLQGWAQPKGKLT